MMLSNDIVGYHTTGITNIKLTWPSVVVYELVSAETPPLPRILEGRIKLSHLSIVCQEVEWPLRELPVSVINCLSDCIVAVGILVIHAVQVVREIVPCAQVGFAIGDAYPRHV